MLTTAIKTNTRVVSDLGSPSGGREWGDSESESEYDSGSESKSGSSDRRPKSCPPDFVGFDGSLMGRLQPIERTRSKSVSYATLAAAAAASAAASAFAAAAAAADAAASAASDYRIVLNDAVSSGIRAALDAAPDGSPAFGQESRETTPPPPPSPSSSGRSTPVQGFLCSGVLLETLPSDATNSDTGCDSEVYERKKDANAGDEAVADVENSQSLLSQPCLHFAVVALAVVVYLHINLTAGNGLDSSEQQTPKQRPGLGQ